MEENIYKPKGTLKYYMVQKCSLIKVLEVFFIEPTSVHFIREISRKINLAPTSVRIHINSLLKEGIILKKESKPFNGYIANRESEAFVYYKRAYNLITLKEIQKKITDELHPKTIAVFGSYSRGEDVETSDIDILVISKVKKEINFEGIEHELKRKISIMIIDNFSKMDKNIQKKVMNGFVIHGGF